MQFDDDLQFSYSPLTTHHLSTIQSVGGVYCLFNKSNGKRYVGKSKNLRKRLKTHHDEIVKGACSNRGMRYDSKDGKPHFVFTVLRYIECERTQEAVENESIYRFSAWDSRFGYNDTCGGRWSLEASQRDHERKYAKRGKFCFLGHLDDNAPMNPVYLYSCAVGRGVLNTFEEGLSPLARHQMAQ